MPSPSKQKGNGYERELVDQFKSHGFDARRAWGSNGKSIGLEEEVDVEVIQRTLSPDKNDVVYHYQAKIRKALPAYLQVPDCCDAVVFRQNRGDSLVLLPLSEYIKLLVKGET